MNLYIYSARNDPYHRYAWATLYPRAEMSRFEALAQRAAAAKVGFSIAISPGNTFDPARSEHRRLLTRKLRQFCDLGCQVFPIFYDDLTAPVDYQAASGVAHADKQAFVINYFLEQLARRVPSARVLCCPTEYGTSKKSLYLSRLHERLDPRVEVMCTSVDGDDFQTFPRTFSNQGARRYFRNFGRKPFLWDNYNCADWALTQLNWSPYQGRGDRLPELCAGIVLNPQHIAMVNWPVFATVGEYLARPRRYRPAEAMGRALDRCLGKAGGVIGRVLAQWYTTEWSGYRASEANLPDSRQALQGGRDQRRRFLRQVRRRVAPLLNLDDRFNRTVMPADWACHLSGYVNLLKGWAATLDAVCSAADADGTLAPEAAQTARRNLAEIRRHGYRMPESLTGYLESLVDALGGG